jgi:hypothetical protein
VDDERLKSVHRGYFKIDEASLRNLRLSMSGPVAFEVSKVFNMSSTSISVIILKTKYYSSISEKNHTETTGSKNWWNLVKSLLGDSNNRKD